MRVVLIAMSAAILAIVLVVGLGRVEAASFPGDSLTKSGVPTVDVRYYRRHPSYYYRRRGGPSYTSRDCYNHDGEFVNCSACGQKRIGREACGASPTDKVRRATSKESNLACEKTAGRCAASRRCARCPLLALSRAQARSSQCLHLSPKGTFIVNQATSRL